MSLRNSFLADYINRILKSSLVSRIVKSSVRPNQFTMLGLALAVIVPVGFHVHPAVGLLFIALSGSADALDGLVARNRGLDTLYGAFLDSSLDRISDFFFLFGFWVLFWKSEKLILASALIFSSFLFTFMISYIKAKAESLGGRCETGLMERGLRTVYLIAWALLLCTIPAAFHIILWSGLLLFCSLTLFTVIQRIVHIRSILTK